jgi:hypothetical protein
MDLQIQLEGQGSQTLKRISFDKEKYIFTVHIGNPDKDEYVFNIDYGYEGFDDPVENGFVELLTHPQHAESDVRCLEIKNGENIQSVGWLCTIGALISDQHDFFDNRHFRKASFMAVQILLNDCRFTKSPTINYESEFKLSDFFDEELSVIVLYKPYVAEIISSDLSEILPCLHQNAFIPYDNKYQHTIEVDNTAVLKFTETSRKLRLIPISSDAQHSEFITQVFRNLLLSAQTPLLRFFIYYQLIESLSSIIFSERQSKNIEDMQPVKNSPFDLYPLIEKLKEDAKEAKRISLLFNEFSGIEFRHNELKNECNKFLSKCGVGEKGSVALAVYEVRNLIFHDLRRIPKAAEPSLKITVELLGSAVTELLINFRIPA